MARCGDDPGEEQAGRGSLLLRPSTATGADPGRVERRRLPGGASEGNRPLRDAGAAGVAGHGAVRLCSGGRGDAGRTSGPPVRKPNRYTNLDRLGVQLWIARAALLTARPMLKRTDHQRQIDQWLAEIKAFRGQVEAKEVLHP